MPRGRLVLALALVALVAAVESWGGLRAGSLALLTDAVHVCMDVFALGIALAAMIGARRPATHEKTFGYERLEVLGALVNGTTLLAATVFIVVQAVHRFSAPHRPEGWLMAAFAGFGLCVNTAVGLLLVKHHKNDLNLQAALYHVAGDALGALAVIVGGAIIAATGAAWIDPALALFVAAIIIAGVWRVLRDAADILLEGVPRGVSVEHVRSRIAGVTGIVAVHDLHVWTIGSASRALSAHILVDDARISEVTAIQRSIDGLLRDAFGITHVTLQFECETCEPDQRVICTQQREHAPGR